MIYRFQHLAHLSKDWLQVARKIATLLHFDGPDLYLKTLRLYSNDFKSVALVLDLLLLLYEY